MEHAAELSPRQTVHDAVNGRVDGQHEVGHRYQVVDGQRLGWLTGGVEKGKEDTKKEVRQLAEDEDRDHADEEERHGSALTQLTVSREIGATLPHTAHRQDESSVQEGHGSERKSQPEDEESGGLIDDVVDGALAHRGLGGHQIRLVTVARVFV